MMNKFNNSIFTTRAVKEELPEEVLLFIVGLVQNMHKEVKEVDYLQVITIENNFLVHTQEIPEYKKEYKLSVSVENCKLFFIDNGEYSTLMFNHVY